MKLNANITGILEGHKTELEGELLEVKTCLERKVIKIMRFQKKALHLKYIN